MSETYPALRHRDFRLLLCGTLGATAAQWIQAMTLGWIVYDLTKSGTLLGLVMGIRAVPMLLLAPIAGTVADRYSRRRVLLFAQFLQLAACLALAAIIFWQHVAVWHLFAFMLVVSAGGVFDRTLRQTLVFEAVPRNEVVGAVSLLNVAFSLTRAISPALGGFLLAVAGAAGNFLCQAAAYAFAAGAAAMLRIGRVTRPSQQSAAADLREGLAYAVRDPVTRVLLAIGVVPYILLIPLFPTLLPIFAARVFDSGPIGLGIMGTAIGAGGVVGGLLLPRAARFDRLGLAQVAAMVLFALSMIGLALSPNMTLAVICLFVAGLTEILHFSLNSTMMQMAAPEHLRGRVSGLLAWNPAMIALGSVVVGAAADLASVRVIVVVFSTAAIAIALALWLRSPVLRGLRLSAYVKAPAKEKSSHSP